MKKLYVLLAICTFNLYSQEGRLIRNPIRNIPKWVRNEFSVQHLDQKYSVIYQLYPYYLRGDFNCDGRKDVAIQVAEIKSGKMGIAIFHTKKPQALITQISIIGAGNSLGKAGNNLKWANIWNVQRHANLPANIATKLPSSSAGDVIFLSMRDSINGFIYWDGKNYLWQQGK